MTAETEIMFTAWGKWHRGDSSLLIPKRNTIGRCIDEGPGASHSTVIGVPHMPPVVEVTERFCLTLSKPILRAIKHYYIGQEPAKQASQKMRISEDDFNNRITYANMELEVYLIEN